MPTSRTRTLLLAALLLYFFANQTQVGWLYIMSALLAGLLPAAWLFGWRRLRKISGERTTDNSEIYESDTLDIRLQLHNAGRGGVYQLRTTENCPLAPSDSPQRAKNIFIPAVPPRDAVQFEYEVTVDKRGLHEFPPLALNTRAPFGLFRWHRELALPSPVLVYPEVRKLRRLSLLDYNRAQQSARPKSGMGSEVIGVRPFRSGDSPRHLHWRSMARTGQLMSKEFADEAQPGLALVLDLFRHPYAQTVSKHTPFEWAVKVAVSIADYAYRRHYPLYLIADDEVLPIPGGAVAWDTLLQYMARVQPTGHRPLAAVLEQAAVHTLVAAVLPYPDTTARDALVGLRYRGCSLLSVLIDPLTFHAEGISAHLMSDSLKAVGVDTCLIRYGTDWTEQLVSQEEAFEA